MLEVKEINTFYGLSQTLYDMYLNVKEAEVVTLLGRNGMGKSTTVKSIMALAPVKDGEISFGGKRIEKLASYQIARLGIGLVPEGRQIFPNLTVFENIIGTAANYRKVEKPYTLDNIFTIFPKLKDRLKHYGNQLSGGEQQMLAIGRALMTNPRLLILDEATEGLAPLVRKEIWRGLSILKNKGLAILVIDKNIESLLGIAQRHYIMENGRIVWEGSTETLKEEKELQSRYLGV